MPVEELLLLGHGPVGIMCAHKGKEGVAVYGAGLAVGACLDMLRDAGASGERLVAERARDLLGLFADFVVFTRSEVLLVF